MPRSCEPADGAFELTAPRPPILEASGIIDIDHTAAVMPCI
jgi:hypothetical protein